MLFTTTQEELAFAVKALDRKITRGKKGEPNIGALYVFKDNNYVLMVANGIVNMQLYLDPSQTQVLDASDAGLEVVCFDLKKLGEFIKAVPKESVVEVSNDAPFMVDFQPVFKSAPNNGRPPKVSVTLSGKDLMAGIKKCVPFADLKKQHPQYFLECLQFRVKESSTTILGCDGFHLAEYTVDNVNGEQTAQSDGALQIPASIMDDFRKIFTAKTMPKNVLLKDRGTDIAVYADHRLAMFVPVKVDKKGKPVEKLMDDKNSFDNNKCDTPALATVRLTLDALKKELENSLVAFKKAHKENPEKFQAPAIRISVNADGSVDFESLSRTNNMCACTTIPYIGELHDGATKASVALNPLFMLDALSGVENEIVELQIWQEKNPVLLCDYEHSFRTLILPIMVFGGDRRGERKSRKSA